MNAPVKTTTKDFFSKPMVQEKLKELVGKNAPAFATSVLQIVNSNSMLVNADPQTIFSAACMAATLNLPINNSLGFAYIVPFKNTKANKIEAQFQLGYKGYIQLAQRSGQFSRIAATPVYNGQLISENPLLGYEFDWSVKPSGEALNEINSSWCTWQAAKAQAALEKDAIIQKLSDQLYAQEMKTSAARVLCETACELLDDYAHQDAMVILNDLEQAMKEQADD